MRFRAALAAGAAFGAAVAVAASAGAQDVSGDPYYGSVSLTAGFVPDPHSLHIGAGGASDASSLGTGCVGKIGGPPDYNLNYTSGGSTLYVSAASETDVSLVINAPDGTWHCDDDSNSGLNPGLTFSKPQSGLYNIWVGRFGDEGDLVNSTLHISEISYFDTLVDSDSDSGGGAIDPSAAPAYGSTSLSGGFLPDPQTVSITPGGSYSASSVNGSCNGNVAAAPDYDLHFTAGSSPLHISAASSSDTTLLINTPSGDWVCDDDSGGDLNPAITFDSPESGLYDIWVGSFGDSGGEATLYISEIGPFGGGSATTSGGSGVDFSADPYFGAIDLTGGFLPDPYTVDLTPGGLVDASSVDASCAGQIGSAPDVNLTFTAGSSPLYIYTGSGQDTTLVVNAPDGSWHCDDDTGGDLNAALTFKSPQSGLYNIWVGRFGEASGDATLYISETGY